jgi:hypothetical protein
VVVIAVEAVEAVGGCIFVTAFAFRRLALLVGGRRGRVDRPGGRLRLDAVDQIAGFLARADVHVPHSHARLVVGVVRFIIVQI